MQHRRESGNQHRVLVRGAASALPVAIAIACAGAASADPAQPGVTVGPNQQGGTGSQPGTTVGPGPAPAVAAPDSPAVQNDQAAPSTDYGATRPVPQDRYEAPIDVRHLHAPIPVRPVAPVRPPANVIRLGEWQAPATWMPVNVRNQINSAAAGVEARITTTARSYGISPARSDHFASSVVAGVGLGAGLAAAAGTVAAGGIPVGALIGGCIGGPIGLAVGGGATITVVGAPLLLVGPLVGSAIGAAVGGVVGGVVSLAALPVAVAAIPVGLAGGVLAGMR